MKNCPSNSAGRTVKGSSVLFDLEGSAANLVHFHRFEQRGEIALAKAFILLALDEFEKDGADHGLPENLEQQARVAFGRRSVEQEDRKSVVSGKRVSVRVDLGGRRNIKKKIK